LREAILDGVFAAGERLIETSLAEQMSVSRGPVRDALRMLAAEGIVKLHPYRGASVAVLTPEDIIEILDLRVVLEGYAARRVAELATQEEIDHLRSIFDKMHELARQGELGALVKNDIAFHEEICRLSRNSRWLQVWHLFAPQIEMFLNLSDRVYMDAELIARMHTDEMEAIEARDPERAEAAAQAALRETAQTIVARMAEI